MCTVWLTLVWAIAVLPAAAQTESEDVDAQQRQAAAEAFDRGTAAFLAREWSDAARWFETAHRLAPAAPALIQAVRAHARAGEDLRAATLALRLQALYGEERQARRIYGRILRDAEGDYVRVDVTCDDECTVELDGTLVEHPSFFLEPDAPVTVAATFEHGRRSQEVSAAAGEVVEVRFEAPPPPPEPVEPDPVEPPPGPDPLLGGQTTVQPPPPEPSGLPPAVFIASTALTLGAVGALVWSGVDTMNDADAYEAAVDAGDIDRARELLKNGEDEERRTNILAGVTAGLGAATVLIAIFTNWEGASGEESAADDGQDIEATVGLSPHGGSLMLQGSF